MKRKLACAVVCIALFACSNNSATPEISVKDSVAKKDTVAKLSIDTSNKKPVVLPVKKTVSRTAKKKAVSTKPKSSSTKQKKVVAKTGAKKKSSTSKSH